MTFNAIDPTSAHVCNLADPWPTGHPLPPIVEVLRQGPRPGTFMIYHNKYSTGGPHAGPRQEVVKVLEDSYVWSPGECRHKGGYRRYNWSVIERGPDGYGKVVVDDKDLTPLPTRSWWGQEPKPIPVHTVYSADLGEDL